MSSARLHPELWSSPLLWHVHFQPSHLPVADPLAWQSILQVDSAAQRENTLAVKNSSSHVHLMFPSSLLAQEPPRLPTALQVPTQKLSPRSHLEGTRAFMSSRLIDCSLQWQTFSESQIPEVCPNITQPNVQRVSPPIEHRIPASPRDSVDSITIKPNIVLLLCSGRLKQPAGLIVRLGDRQRGDVMAGSARARAKEMIKAQDEV